MSDLDQILEHLGKVLYFIADIHPDDRNDAVDTALAFYNERCPNKKIVPSPFGFQRILEPNTSE